MATVIKFASYIFQQSRSLLSVLAMSQEKHSYNGNQLRSPFPKHMKRAIFGLGCFWGAERSFWKLDGVFSTMVGFSGGDPSQSPNYESVVSGMCPGYTEVVKVIYDPQKISYQELLEHFWQSHNPTQGDRQGNDIGEHYRSVVFCYPSEDDVNSLEPAGNYDPDHEVKVTPAPQDTSEQLTLARASLSRYEQALRSSPRVKYDTDSPKITTRVEMASSFHYADDHHQQYLHKNPTGYCSMRGCGVNYPK